MKKVILLLIVICITRFSSVAQLSYGVKAGVNLAFISFSDEKYNTHMKPGILAVCRQNCFSPQKGINGIQNLLP